VCVRVGIGDGDGTGEVVVLALPGWRFCAADLLVSDIDGTDLSIAFQKNLGVLRAGNFCVVCVKLPVGNDLIPLFYV
jgi:hypothetical protein